jgi:hypothetical protein
MPLLVRATPLTTALASRLANRLASPQPGPDLIRVGLCVLIRRSFPDTLEWLRMRRIMARAQRGGVPPGYGVFSA